jgi:hypothetical protein
MKKLGRSANKSTEAEYSASKKENQQGVQNAID